MLTILRSSSWAGAICVDSFQLVPAEAADDR